MCGRILGGIVLFGLVGPAVSAQPMTAVLNRDLVNPGDSLVTAAQSGVSASPEARLPGTMEAALNVTTRRVEIGVAELLYFPQLLGSSTTTFPAAGFEASLAVNLKSWVAVVGETVAYRIRDNDKPYSFMAGPRLFERGSFKRVDGVESTAGAFVQVLTGTVVGGNRPGGLAIQPGAGFVLGDSGRLLLNMQFDYVFVRGDARDRSGLRISLGIVVGLGSLEP